MEILGDGREGSGLQFQPRYGDVTGPGWEGRVWKFGQVSRVWWACLARVGVKMKSKDGKPGKARA